MGWYERAGRWLETHRFVVDLTATAVLALFLTAGAADLYATDPYGDGNRAAPVAWTLVMLVPLPWRRVRPVPSTVAIYGVTLAHMLVGYPMIMPADLLVLVSLFAVTVYGPRWAHVTAVCATAVGCLVVFPITASAAVPDATSGVLQMLPVGVFCLVTGLAVWAFALTRRSRRLTIEVLRDRAHRLEIERDQQARIATAAERSRIAREMHDIVAHSLSIVVAQADGGRYAAASDPAAATRALTTISETGRTALTEMRRLLGVLRSEDGDEREGEDAARAPAPQPGVGELDDLVEAARRSGLRVAVTRLGEPRSLPAGMGLTLYRMCQESLSNVRKHAGPDPAVTVVLHWTSDAVELDVLDDGRGAAAADHTAPGYGLRGMRERASLYGGTLDAGPREGGGFRVHLTLPLPGEGADHDPRPPTTTDDTEPA